MASDPSAPTYVPEPKPDEVVAVIGAGSIGTMLAAHISGGGRRVVICGRTPVERVVVTEAAGTWEHPVEWAAMPEDLPAVRWAVLATKIHQTESAAGWLATLDGDSVLIAAQNGVDHGERLARFTPAMVVPALVFINAERTGPGQVQVRRTGRGVVMPGTAAGRAAANLLAAGGLPIDLADDFLTAAWEKLLTNVTANPITALTGRRMEVLDDPRVCDLALALALETVAVAQAVGAALTEDHAHKILAWLKSLPPHTPSSMLQDRAAGRPLEHEGIFAPVIHLGERHGVPTPVTRAMVALVGALSSV